MDAYTYEDGLGSEAVNDVLTDRFGYVWTAAYSGLHRFDGYDFLNYAADINDDCSLSHPIAVRLLEDREGNLWVGTKAGLNCLDRTTNCFQRYFARPGEERSLPGNDVRDLALGKNDGLYVLTDKGLAVHDPTEGNFRPIPTGAFPVDRLYHCEQLDAMLLVGRRGITALSGRIKAAFTPQAARPTTIFSVTKMQDELILGTDRGLFRWPLGAQEIVAYQPDDSRLSDASLLDLEVQDSLLWVASRGQGLGRIAPGQPVKWFREGLTDQHVRALSTDERGNLWIGTYVGLNRRSLRPSPLTHYRSTGKGKKDQILEIGLDQLGGLYFYRRWDGLYRAASPGLPPRKLAFPKNDFLNGRDLNHILSLRDGNVLLARGYDGLYLYDPEREVFLPKITSVRLREVSVTVAVEDPDNPKLLWLASDDGLVRLHRQTGEERWFFPQQDTPLAGFVITSLLPSPDGKIWLSCGDYYNDRLGYFDPATSSFHFLDYEPGSQTKIAGGRIKQLAWGNDGGLWAAAAQGLIGIDTLTRKARLITEISGEKIGTPESIVRDSAGVLWFGTGDRLGSYSPKTGELLFRDATALQQFSNAAAGRHPDGRLVFGGQRGLVSLDPARRMAAPSFPRIVFNELRVNGQNHETASPLPGLEELRLSPRQRSLTLTFSALQFDKARKIRYAYRLGEEDAWKPLGPEKSLSFTQLSPGTHRLKLRSDDGQGNWNPESRQLLIVAQPRLLELWWFRLLLGLLTLTAVGLLARSWIIRRIERQEHAQLVELDAFKSRLFANLTHEFRTPLTLILGPAKRLLRTGQERADPTLAREARRIDRQGKRLLRMINQLLDLQKLEAGRMQLYESPVPITNLLRELLTSFGEEAKRREVELTLVDKMTEPITLIIDRDKLESILTNLVANGLRFSPPASTLSLILDEQGKEIVISVRDDGPGISPTDQQKIFDRYVQADDGQPGGTGIGLALVRELTELMGGSIALSSSPGQGSTFSVSLPKRGARSQDAGKIPGTSTATEVESTPAEERSPTDTRPIVLIVEDDAELSSYLEESLTGPYRVVVAPDGVAGVSAATELIPDLVVSDVMMPNLNGYQLCAQLKADERTSHLPILLLTAKSADEHRLEGLERGADAYLSKPFSERELKLRLRNLLHLRERTAAKLREGILDQEMTRAPSPSPENPEAIFLERIRQYVQENLADTTLSVADLERVSRMSRSQLHRKLQSTIGLSASKFINQLRLQAAARALRRADLSISTIAYDCGFQDPSYFGKKFRERYHCTPSEWRQAGREGAG